MTYKLFDVVETTVSLPTAGFPFGAVGAIVDVYSDGMFEVEFINSDGESVALLPLSTDQIRPADSSRFSA